VTSYKPTRYVKEEEMTQKTDFRPVLPGSAIRHPCVTQRGPLPLLPHGPSGVHRHLPRRTQLRRPTGLEENRSIPLHFIPSAGWTYPTPIIRIPNRPEEFEEILDEIATGREKRE